MGDEEVEVAPQAEAICAGFLRAQPNDCGGRRARCDGRRPEDGGDRGASIASLIRAADAARTRAPSLPEVEHEIAAHGLDWIRIEAETLELADAEAAREPALCVRVDGAPWPTSRTNAACPRTPSRSTSPTQTRSSGRPRQREPG